MDDAKGSDAKSKKPTTPKTPRERQTKEESRDKTKFPFKTQDSMPSPVQEEPSSSKAPPSNGATTARKNADNNGRTSSCLIDFKTVWFNFAAPPSVPITRKIDYTRLDWNLLSTASPAITAWMNPSNRFAIKFVAMMKAFHLRRTAVAACLMAESLEVQSVQKHPKTRYSGKFTPLAKTLQEDPSCQLCTVMTKYVLLESASKIDNILKHPDLPPLTFLRQGVIVLSRQWKNMLYNPMLFEHQYKNKLSRPINVTYAMSQTEEVHNINIYFLLQTILLLKIFSIFFYDCVFNSFEYLFSYFFFLFELFIYFYVVDYYRKTTFYSPQLLNAAHDRTQNTDSIDGKSKMAIEEQECIGKKYLIVSFMGGKQRT